MTNVLKWDWTSRWNINNATVGKGAVGLLVLHIVGDHLFESTFQNTNEVVTRSFSCFYLQKNSLLKGKKNKNERLKTKECVMPLFIPQRSSVTGSNALLVKIWAIRTALAIHSC